MAEGNWVGSSLDGLLDGILDKRDGVSEGSELWRNELESDVGFIVVILDGSNDGESDWLKSKIVLLDEKDELF